MHWANRHRAWYAFLAPGLVALLAAATPAASSATSARTAVGYLTWVKGSGVTLRGHHVPPFGAKGWDKTHDSKPLYATDQLTAAPGALADYTLSVKNAKAFCETTPGTVKVLPGSQNVLLQFGEGVNSCGMDSKGAERFYYRVGETLKSASPLRLGAVAPAPTVVSVSKSDPIFKVVVTKTGRTIRVGRGVLVVGGAGGAEQAVVLGKNEQTVVPPGGTPATPKAVAPSAADNKFVKALPAVPDTPAPTVTDLTGPPNPSSLRSATFTFKATDPGATFSCAVDDTDYRLCTSGSVYDQLPPGPHTFRVRATNSAGNTSPVVHLDWTIDHSKIVFESLRDGVFQVYSMNPGGTEVTNLSRSSASDKDPAWSRDGSKIAFQSDREPGQDTNIYAMNPAGGNQIRLTTGRFNGNPAWSPDGRRIVFESTRTGKSEIYVMNADGSNQTQITFNDPITTDAAWSPDGSKIAFASTLSGRYQIYTMSPDGSNRVRVTNADATELGPAWSPDGQRIAFYSDRDKSASRIYTVKPDGSDPKAITAQAAGSPTTIDSNPTWAPDGHDIAFQRFFPGVAPNGANALYVVNADDGTGPAKVTEVAGVKGDGLVPNWDTRYPALQSTHAAGPVFAACRLAWDGDGLPGLRP